MSVADEKRQILDKAELLASLFAGLPQAALVVDADMRVVLSNPAAARLFEPTNPQLMWTRTGEVFACIHSRQAGCGKAGGCTTCIIRAAVSQAISSRSVQRRRTRVERLSDGATRESHLLVTAVPLRAQPIPLAALLMEDVGELLSLPGLLPICASCKKVRRDDQVWESIEEHLGRRLDLDFSHSLCPACAAQLYPREG